MVAEDRSEMVHEEYGSAGFSDLMPELLSMIAENLSSYLDYIHFRRCNKACANIGPRKNPFQPCLIYKDKDANGVYQYYITDPCKYQNRKLRINNIPDELRGKSIYCWKNGWLLLGDKSDAYYTLFNPLTSQTVQTVCNTIDPSMFIISGNPSKTSPENCTIFSLPHKNSTTPQLYRGNPSEPGKAEWVVSTLPGSSFLDCGGVLWRGSWYILTCAHNGALGCFKFTRPSPEVAGWEDHRNLTYPNYRPSHTTYKYLTKCGGELLSLFIDGDVENPRVKVFKTRDDEMKWEEIDSLKGYCLYLGRQASMSCLAESPDLADRIYFPDSYNDGLVYYSLRTKKYHSIHTVLKDSDRLARRWDRRSAWIKPEYWN